MDIDSQTFITSRPLTKRDPNARFNDWRNSVKPVYNGHLYNKIYPMGFIQ